MMYGTRLMMRFQLWLFGLAMAGFIVAGLTLLFTSRDEFIKSYNSYARPFTHQADTYNYFIAQANKAGVVTSGPTDWHNTIVASGAIIAFGVWVWFSTNLAGEIRQAGTRSNWYSMLSGLAITFGSITLMVILLYHTVGQTFLTAVNGIAGDSKVYTLPNQPWWITLVAAIHTNTIFVAFLGITFLCWAPLIVYIQIVQPVRALFAWSFDQLIPEKLASINPRTHTPVFTLALIGLISIPSLYAAAYTTSFFKYIALSTVVGFPVFVLVGIGAILFPYRKKAAYEASVSNINFLGLPLMVYFGVGSILAGLFGAWLWFAYPTLGLPNAGQGIADQLFTTPGQRRSVADRVLPDRRRADLLHREGRAQIAGHRPRAQLPRDPARVGVVFRRRKAEGGGGAALRLYYASDIHGTEVLWLKFLNAPKHYKARVLVMGGDVTGKMVIPLVEDPAGRVHRRASSAAPSAPRTSRSSTTLERRIRGNGMYPYRTTAEEVAQIGDLPEEEREHWFEGVMLQTFSRWLDLADERLADTGIRCFVMPGNDDPTSLEEQLSASQHVEACDERIVEFDGYTMLSLGYSNRTPWDSPRELDEDELYRRIAGLADAGRGRLALHLQPARAALRLRPRHGGGARRRLQRGAARQGAAHDPGRLDRRARGDRELPADRGACTGTSTSRRARRASAARCASTRAATTTPAASPDASSTSTARRPATSS